MGIFMLELIYEENSNYYKHVRPYYYRRCDC